MKQFYPTYLYIKTHNITGLKYFGKTTNDPYRYYGSGKHWTAHLKKHGYNISTEVIGYYTNKDECCRIAELFSSTNNIVESKDWANLIAENGLDGGWTGYRSYKHTPESRAKMSASKLGQVPWNKGLKGVTPGNKQPCTAETKEKLRQFNLGKKLSEETCRKMSETRKGKPRPEAREWLTGRTPSEETKKKIAESNRGKIVSDETKQKIKEARAKQTFSDETKKKLSGSVVVVDKNGKCCRISKELYYSQPNTGDDRDYVFHNSKEGNRRKNT